MKEKNMPRPSDTTGSKPVLKLADADDTADITSLAFFALDSQGKVLNAALVNNAGQFDIPRDALAKAARIVLAPAPRGDEPLDIDNAVPFHLRDFINQFNANAVFELDKSRWTRLFPIRRCADGSIEHCHLYPWILQELELRAIAGLEATTPKARVRLEEAARILPNAVFRRPCSPICDGEVEVYRRICCCRPYVIHDSRIFDLIRDLTRIVETIPIGPIGPIGPGPGPDPAPFLRLSARENPLIHESGTLNEAAVNAAADLQALRTLAPTDQLAYIESRPYLFCWNRCGAPRRVGRGFLQPDGTFRVCWTEPLTFLRMYCHEEFAFKVTQVVNGVPVVIYDGVAAHQWFDSPHGIDLQTYSPYAQSCNHGDMPEVDGAAALLLDIGLTESWRLKTPDADGPLSVATPADFNDGLLYPGPVANRANNVNLGGTLSLLYGFTESLRSVAKYYRVSVSSANASGNPTGPRRYFEDSLSWKYLVFTPAGLETQSQFLGPQPVGASTGLYLIPYRADHEYKSIQFHAAINTASLPEGRYLLTLEVFNAAGQRLHPNGTPAVDPADVAGGFTFNRWFQEIGPTAIVPFGALTHLLWWDNRPVVGDIVDLRQDGVASDAECQFLSGSSDAEFTMGFRAYHPEPLFLQGYGMNWRRGLGGGSGSLGGGSTNAGQPPGPPAISDVVTFEDMLTPEDRKCAFSVNLGVTSKTSNGFGRLGIDANDQAAFAVEIV
jgi:hypothetical protein